jgi:HK97 family phage prohead protease
VADELGLRSWESSRTYALDDLHVRSDGGGRVVEAYAATFGHRAEVMDQDGHYHEELSPGSFTTTIATRGTNFGVLFNHGRTIDGTPSDLGTLPIGVPLEVRADDHGVFTATRYLDNPLADQVLGAIKAGAIRAQSFSGRFRKSTRTYPDGRGRQSLPLITRHEVEMREYGPAVFAAYEGAAILGTRADVFVRSLLAVPPQERLQWLEQFEGLTTGDSRPGVSPPGTSTEAAAAGIEPKRSDRPTTSLRARIHAARVARGMES